MDRCLTAEISAGAVRRNLARLRERLAPGAKLCAVVKSDCYGHGQRLLLETIAAGADWLAVATPAEAVILRYSGWDGDVLVFFSTAAFAPGAERRDALEALIRRGVTLTVTSPDEAPDIAAAAGRARRAALVHVKIDTGMSRSGVLWERAAALVAALRETDGVRLTGAYTHFATADEADKSAAREQFRRFATATTASGATGLMRHAANSAALIDLPETHLDMARPGIALYGYQPSDAMHTKLPLEPCLRLWGRLMQVKDVPPGSRCGYGLTYECPGPARLGLAPVGYGDGYFRCLGNRASMRVRGRDVPIRGRVSMDQVILDLSEVPEAEVGDEVEIISASPGDPHSVENLARLAGTIPYEITCRLGPRVRRVLVEAPSNPA